LKPYDSWEEFSPVIENVFKIYLETAKPKGLRHIAIRYINRIEVPRANISWESLFRLRVLIPQDLPENIEAFLIGVNLPYEDAKDILRIQLGTVNTEATDIIAMLLEITYIFTQPGEIPLPDVLQRVNVAHKHVENAFESCLTDELKQTFEEVKG
jgi:uncharacterized protein (TIGR04255 family)